MVEDQILLKQAQQHDQDALGMIFDRYYDALYRYIYVHIRQQHDAEDLASQVFQRLLHALHGDNPPDTHLKAWLYRVAHNLIVDYTRRQQHRQHDLLPDKLMEDRPSPETQVDLAMRAEMAQDALEHLSEDQRQVVVLRYMHGLSLAETADIMQRKTGAIKALQHRAINALRGLLLLKEGNS